MRNLTLPCLTAFVAISVMISGAVRDTATAESAAVTNYKQAVSKRVEQWSGLMAKANDDLTKANTALAAALSNPTHSEAEIKDLQHKIAVIQDSMNYYTNDMRIAVGLMTVSPPDKNEANSLPGWLNAIVKAKGIPLGNNVSITPNFNWNFKSGTLGSAGGTIIIKFRTP